MLPKKHDFASDPRINKNQETGKWFYVGEDNLSYEFDENLNAWFPMYNEQLMQAQASVYAVQGVEEVVQTKEKKKKRPMSTYENMEEAPKKPKIEKITSVYVTGIPFDVTTEELKTTFSKCGMIMEDVETGDSKIKIYRDEKGTPKGDALVSYFKEESVSLAIELLDEAELRPGDKATKMSVSKAVFKEKKEPAEKRQPNKDKAKKKIQQLKRRLDWVDDESGKRQEKFAKIVILKNMYTQQELDEDPTLLLELKEDVRDECEKLGEVTNVILYDKSPGGVISVRFKEKESADACIALMNDRFFAGKQIVAEVFDGKTRYQKSGGKTTEEDEEAEKQRLERYAKWLEDQGGEENAKTP